MTSAIAISETAVSPGAIDQRNAEAIAVLHNRFAGERLFVMGTGPSLDLIPDALFSRLRHEWLFGVNTLLTYDRLTWTPMFYGVAEVGWLVDNQPFNLHRYVHGRTAKPRYRFYTHPFPMHRPQPGTQFAAKGLGAFREEMADWVYVRQDRDEDMQQEVFQGLGEDMTWVPGGIGSVAMFAVMLGCWMGFKSIYLLGCDATRTGYAKGLSWEPSEPQRARQDNFVRAAMTAEEVMRGAGRVLVDCTEGGLLPLPKMRLEDVL